MRLVILSLDLSTFITYSDSPIFHSSTLFAGLLNGCLDP